MSNVVIRGSSITIEDWDQANREMKEKLPPLSAEQREVSRKLGISEEDYARNLRAMQFGENRIRKRVEELKAILVDLVKKIAKDVNVGSLTFDVWQDEYTVLLKKNHREMRCRFSRELGKDILDSIDQRSLIELKKRLKIALKQAHPV